LFQHGWPELGLSWHHHAKAAAALGYFSIVPDLRGFGRSHCPQDRAAYGIDALVGDGCAILDHFGKSTAVWAGHDWGGIIVWHAAMLVPERVAGIIAVNTPHFDRPPAPPIDVLRARYGDAHYMVAFQEDGAGALFEARPHEFIRFMFQRVDKPAPDDPRRLPASIFDLQSRFAAHDRAQTPPPVVDDAVIEAFAAAFAATGFEPGMNLYRNLDDNYHRLAGVSHIIAAPALMVTASHDWYLPPNFTLGMERLVPDVTIHRIENCGHWTMWEKPEELATLIEEWLIAQDHPAKR
jgi:pimeloyl-ACP methyl ester carboxylesterase